MCIIRCLGLASLPRKRLPAKTMLGVGYCCEHHSDAHNVLNGKQALVKIPIKFNRLFMKRTVNASHRIACIER